MDTNNNANLIDNNDNVQTSPNGLNNNPSNNVRHVKWCSGKPKEVFIINELRDGRVFVKYGKYAPHTLHRLDTQNLYYELNNYLSPENPNSTDNKKEFTKTMDALGLELIHEVLGYEGAKCYRAVHKKDYVEFKNAKLAANNSEEVSKSLKYTKEYLAQLKMFHLVAEVFSFLPTLVEGGSTSLMEPGCPVRINEEIIARRIPDKRKEIEKLCEEFGIKRPINQGEIIKNDAFIINHILNRLFEEYLIKEYQIFDRWPSDPEGQDVYRITADGIIKLKNAHKLLEHLGLQKEDKSLDDEDIDEEVSDE